MNGYRIFVLGAGFSRPAGLPLASELWEEVMARARQLDWAAEELEYELKEFERYRGSRGDDLSVPVDFEDFLSFLDFEHALGLKGSKSFSDEGNRLQLTLKWLIAQVIVERTPEPSDLPDCYVQFAEALQPTDYVLTFNYDTVLEDSLDRIGKPYRLFTDRYEEIDGFYATTDNSVEEVVVIKLHGSVDWFDKARYDEQVESRRASGLDPVESPPVSIVFNPSSPVSTVPLLEGPQFDDDPLTSAHRVVSGLEWIYGRQPNLLVSPLMLAPSYAKVLYAARLKYFFWGLGRTGGYNMGIVVVGYSLPRHDDYARLILLRMFANYQQLSWEHEFAGLRKKPVLLIDYRPSSVSEAYYRLAFSFSESDKTNYFLDGFGDEAVQAIRELT